EGGGRDGRGFAGVNIDRPAGAAAGAGDVHGQIGGVVGELDDAIVIEVAFHKALDAANGGREAFGQDVQGGDRAGLAQGVVGFAQLPDVAWAKGLVDVLDERAGAVGVDGVGEVDRARVDEVDGAPFGFIVVGVDIIGAVAGVVVEDDLLIVEGQRADEVGRVLVGDAVGDDDVPDIDGRAAFHNAEHIGRAGMIKRAVRNRNGRRDDRDGMDDDVAVGQLVAEV